MIGSLLLFLGSVGYVTHKAASSQRAQFEMRNYERNLGINVERQMELERMACGKSPYDRTQFVNLLKNADLSNVDMKEIHEVKRQKLLEQYGNFDDYSQVNNQINCFDDMIPYYDRNYAVWIISKSEGWRYNKSMIDGLPSFCDGYDSWQDSQIRKIGRRI